MFEGVFTALVTPFRDGEIDAPALHALVDHQIDAGIDGVVPCGSTGESATLSHAEHRRVVEIAVEAAGGRIPVVAGTGSNNTREAIELTLHAKEAGADGALLISPYYNKPTQEGIFAHFEAVARETGLPLVVYNIPGRTASNIAPGTLARLADVDSIVGVKEACGDLDQIAHVVAACRDDFAVLSGDDALTLPLLAIGGKGVISVSSNVAPREMLELVREARAGRFDRALGVHQRLLPLFDALFCETNPIPVKAAVALQGRCGDEIRLPLTPISDGNRERLRVVMKELELL
ncbi:MAG: 4-hydroxy-tetrahydrodipicolinate synthase [Myxococcota bacterium]|nr:4-hydroxy-tetrahydrodipicolinate synthase [Deltaproteobacteria bacterium]MCP4244061.1 4-hydroxy-tetrahydrodipicolinate synthase [bacterium]MDP6076323.1 4-hydroxy-tetrahydrodipicolinate synthase [Myxococcota bacterium]MDP6243658.1 4-hydroxy-tetrahydrodipicolinate synthase [Myxococcota bacterium]MDP7074831.1 4-hydroxy-tetrahydrodipicolinate synthase [Myxococcota bacterium]